MDKNEKSEEEKWAESMRLINSSDPFYFPNAG